MGRQASAEKSKVVISERALVQRVRKALEKDRRTVRSLTRGPDADRLGPFYVLDLERNLVQRQAMGAKELLELGREIGVVQPWEEVAS